MKERKKFRFYGAVELGRMRDALEEGRSISDIADELSKEFDRPKSSMYAKLIQLNSARKSNKVVKSMEEKMLIRRMEKTPVNKGISLPKGFTFEGVASRVVLHSDRFEVYF